MITVISVNDLNLSKKLQNPYAASELRFHSLGGEWWLISNDDKPEWWPAWKNASLTVAAQDQSDSDTCMSIFAYYAENKTWRFDWNIQNEDFLYGD